ncbi:MAG: nicotinate-nucleotide adenylyltransferase [Bacteroidetes bacterium]|nr:nicotinate-nucleotide adenylyltransferase [Bacteroidota bacterium]
MNIGVYGGTFDPPHIGHLILAQQAIDTLGLDRVLLVPAFQSPFKTGSESLSVELRSEMVALAVSGNDRLDGEYHEAQRGGVSFTVDTLRHVREKQPDDTLFLLMGADTFDEFHLWKEPESIIALATIAVAQRPGVPLDLASHPYGSIAQLFEMPQIDVSSTDIRKRIHEGRSIRYLVPWAVEVFIASQGLYREHDA